MTRTKSTIGISAVALVASALLGAACSSDATPSGGGGAGGSGGASGHAGTAGVGTAGHAGTAGAAGQTSGGAGGAGGAPNNCTPLPANHLLTDFSPATFSVTADNTTWSAGKATLWGNTTSLMGGDVFYQGKAESALKVTLHGQTLTVSGSIAPGDYAGYMFNFKPACTNASSTQGLKFDVLTDSTVGNATLKVQMQQKSDYPSTANPGSRPGNCVPQSVDTQYNDCLSPATTVVSSGSTLSSGPVELLWTSFSGGAPTSAVQSDQLMAIQWQFECPPEGGTVVTAAGGSGGGDSAGTGGGGGSSAGAGGSSGAAAGSDTGGVGGSGGASGGASGDSGSGGASGSSGTGGSDGGSAGTAGAAAGSAGTAGSGGSSGSSAGSSGAAGSSAGAGGSSSTPSACVVSFTIDNVTFY